MGRDKSRRKDGMDGFQVPLTWHGLGVSERWPHGLFDGHETRQTLGRKALMSDSLFIVSPAHPRGAADKSPRGDAQARVVQVLESVFQSWAQHGDAPC